MKIHSVRNTTCCKLLLFAVVTLSIVVMFMVNIFPNNEVQNIKSVDVPQERSDLDPDLQDWSQKSCQFQEMGSVNDFYGYIYQRPFRCDLPMVIGGPPKSHRMYKEGAKYVCMSPKMNFVPGNCLVYSFGIARDFSFDDAMDKIYGCKVHSYDPTIGKETHDRSPNIRFHNLGIANRTDRNAEKLKVDRYINILKENGHEHSVIDYLKMDVEGYEREFFNDVFSSDINLLKNIKQIGMEIHPGSKAESPKMKAYWRIFQQLECLGFRLWSTETNTMAPTFLFNGIVQSCCYEVVWIRDKQW